MSHDSISTELTSYLQLQFHDFHGGGKSLEKSRGNFHLGQCGSLFPQP